MWSIEQWIEQHEKRASSGWEDGLEIVDGKIALIVTRDDPELGRKAGDKIWVEWGGIRYPRPTTTWARSIPRSVRHEPYGASACACGDTFESRDEAERHCRANVPAWSRVRFRYDGPNGEQIARPLDGHEMRFRVRRDDGSRCVVCECGFEYSAPDLEQAGPVAREHIRDTLRARLDVAWVAS